MSFPDRFDCIVSTDRPHEPSSFDRFSLDFVNIPIMHDVAKELATNFSVSEHFATLSALIPASLAIERCYVVKIGDSKPIGTNLNVLNVAPPAYGKSNTFKASTEVVCEFEKSQRAAYDAKVAKYESDLRLWKHDFRALSKKMSKLSEKGIDVTELRKQLGELSAQEPTMPVCPRLILDNTTQHGVYRHLADFPWGGIVSAEGGSFFHGKIIETTELLNALYSGEPISLDRHRGDPIIVRDAKMMIGLCVQTDIVKRFVRTKIGENAFLSGFFDRFIISWASHDPVPVNRDRNVGWAGLEKFNVRILELLDEAIRSFECSGYQPKALKFDVDANDELKALKNHIFWQGRLHDYGSKAPGHKSRLHENVARVAAILHVLSKQEGDIGFATVRAAYHICYHSAVEYIGKFLPPSQVERDAANILAQLQDYQNSNPNATYVNKRFFTQRIQPKEIRFDGRSDRALELLKSSGKINIIHRMNNVKDIIFYDLSSD